MGEDGNVGIAFALVCAAGASSAIGAAVVFFPCLIKLTSKLLLGAGLGFSAGVLLFVGFADILNESYELFVAGGQSFIMANLYASLSFFGGVAMMLLLDIIVRIFFDHKHEHCNQNEQTSFREVSAEAAAEQETAVPMSQTFKGDVDHKKGEAITTSDLCQAPPQSQITQNVQAESSPGVGVNISGEEGTETCPNTDKPDVDKNLTHVGIKTALAIAVHNFPEGLATFVAALGNPEIGVILAVAIALHNIPLGLSVALPMYYATGSRCRAFLWGIIPAVAQPFAALMGYLFLAHYMNDIAYAIMFGIVAGLMVIVSMKELLPAARRYDPRDAVVTLSLFAGMFVVAISLVFLHEHHDEHHDEHEDEHHL